MPGRYSVDIGASNTLTFFTPTVEQYGLRTALAPSVRMVTGVSPAADAGVQVGDVVLTIDSIALSLADANATRESLRIVADKLQQTPGTNVKLRLMGASGTEREVTLVLRDLI